MFKVSFGPYSRAYRKLQMLLQVSVNPEYRVAEKNFSNNAVICDLYYNRVQALVSNCVYTAP